MPRRNLKSLEDQWYDLFMAWEQDDQAAALKVLNALYRAKVRESEQKSENHIQTVTGEA